MRGPHRPRKTLKAAQTVIIGISELMFYMIIYNTELLSKQALILPQIITLLQEPLDSVGIAPGSARTPLYISSYRLDMEQDMDTQSIPHSRVLHQGV